MLIDTSALTAPPEDFAALSIEPEGLSPLGHRVFFISSLKYHGEEEAGAFARYVKCGEPQPVSPRRARARDSEDELLPAEEAYRQLIDFAAGAVLVVHGAESLRFLREELSGGRPLPCPVADLEPLARQRLPHLASHGLPELSRYFSAGEQRTGARLPNARAIAVAFSRCCRLDPQPRPYRSWLPSVPPCPPRPGVYGSVRVQSPDLGHPLFARGVVFAGKLTTPRSELARLAAACGAAVHARVSPLVDIVVAGAGSDRALAAARELNAAGRTHIEVLGEAEFLLLARGGD